MKCIAFSLISSLCIPVNVSPSSALTSETTAASTRRTTDFMGVVNYSSQPSSPSYTFLQSSPEDIASLYIHARASTISNPVLESLFLYLLYDFSCLNVCKYDETNMDIIPIVDELTFIHFEHIQV